MFIEKCTLEEHKKKIIQQKFCVALKGAVYNPGTFFKKISSLC